MKLTIEFPDYIEKEGIDVIWHKHSNVDLRCDTKTIILTANAEGLRSLGEQMIYLAQNDIEAGSHVHLDDFFCGSGISGYNFIIEKS